MEHYSTIKRDEVVIPATTWMSVENTALSERGQTQKVRHYVIPFM